MVPLAELDPDWVDPLLGKKAKKILEELKFSGADVDFKRVEVDDE
jgi:2-amino-4-hydroxy-6-hydroxymethyldihydropteridine diphosphokinase